jgi:tetrahydromethanopterin S-methyltransferase subunit A
MSEVRAGASFYQGDADSPVAVCTLSSFDLLEELAQAPIAARLAIIGPLETENVGLERMLMTLLERPRIRWLIMCGDEHRGRRPAQALACLMETGIAQDGTIPGARSKLARLSMLGPKHIGAVQRQIRVRDLVGVHDIALITAAAEACFADDPGKFPEHVALPKPEPIAVPQQTLRVREQDPSGFLVILVDRENAQLLVEHYNPEGALLHRFAGPDAESLCVALVDWTIVTRLEHAAYLGRELAKAEFALTHDLTYRQDAPLR